MKRFTNGVAAIGLVLLTATTIWAALPGGFPGARSYHYSLSVYLQNGMKISQMLYNNVKDGDYNHMKAQRDAQDLMARLEYARRDADSMDVSATPEELKAMKPYVDSLHTHLANISQDLKQMDKELSNPTPDRQKMAEYAADLYWQFKDAEMNDHKEIKEIRHINDMEEPPLPALIPRL